MMPKTEPNVCDSCLFCSRDGVRHHKDKKNENRLIRRVRSPCRCYHTCIQEGIGIEQLILTGFCVKSL